MKYFFAILILFAACTAPEEKKDNGYSAQNLEAAKKAVDSIHVLMRTAAADETKLVAVEPGLSVLKDAIKKYSAALSGSDSVAFLKYSREKETETMEWINNRDAKR